MLYGTIYGDIAGSMYEFRSVKDYNFTSVPKVITVSSVK